MKTHYKQEFDAENIPIDANILHSYQKNAEKSLLSIKKNYRSKNLSLLQLPGKTSDIKVLENTAAHYCENFDDVIVLGTGGSVLGSRAICTAAKSGGSSSCKRFEKVLCL